VTCHQVDVVAQCGLSHVAFPVSLPYLGITINLRVIPAEVLTVGTDRSSRGTQWNLIRNLIVKK
jgi:hypothetical protein